MARNIVAANLIMAFFLLGGIGMAFFITKEVMPNSTLDVVDVRVTYPGASPSEVERGILLSVEEAVRGLDVVEEVTSRATEGYARVTIELTTGADRERGLQAINQAVDSITTFPEETERPYVSLRTQRRDVLELRLFGDVPQMSLFRIAEDVRDTLVRSGEVTQVEIDRNPQRIVHVEIPSATLRELGLTLDDVSARIREASDDVPAGNLKTGQGNLAVRLTARKQYA
ncbi:MAG: efflux RND transporter permease subunit, partial [Planctomycetota bacterium]